jgi:hypothetical protein
MGFSIGIKMLLEIVILIAVNEDDFDTIKNRYRSVFRTQWITILYSAKFSKPR